MVHLAIGACLVDQVDGLIGQETLVDILRAGGNGKLQSLIRIVHAMKLLIALLQLFQDLEGLLRRGLCDVDLLEASHQTSRLREMTVVFLVGRRTDKADLGGFEVGLEHVRGIHRALAVAACPHEVVDLVDVDDVIVRFADDAVHHLLDALLEVTAELRASQKRTQVELVYLTAFQTFRHLIVVGVDPRSKAIDDGSLSHARLSDMQGVVLLLATEHLDGAQQFVLPADEGIVQHVGIVQTGHHLAPGLLVLLFLRIAAIAHLVVVCLIASHQHAQELTLPVTQQVPQQIGGIRLLEVEDAPHDMRHVDILRARVLHCLVGGEQGCAQLFAGADHIVAHILGHALHLLEIVLQTFVHDVQVDPAVDERLVELILPEQGVDEVFGRGELVAVFLCRRVHVLKGLVHLLCIVDIHIVSLFFGFVGQAQGETLVAGHLRGLVHFRHSDVVRVDAHHRLVGVVHHEHEGLGIGLALEKHHPEHLHHKLHRGEVVVVDGHLVAARLVEVHALPFLDA